MTAPEQTKALIAMLWRAAYTQSAVERDRAEAKSLRQTDNLEGRTDLYSWTKREDTLHGRAARALETLLTDNLAAERRIVAWLRGEVPSDYTDPQYDIGRNLADAIERGEHRKGEQAHDPS